MFLIKYNNFTGKYYKYDTDDHDIFAPMFDEGLHKNDIIAHCEPGTKVCAYCHTEFSSRNQLFKHLGYHGLDIRDFTRFDTDVMMDTMFASNNAGITKSNKGKYNLRKKQFKTRKGDRNNEKDLQILLNEMRL